MTTMLYYKGASQIFSFETRLFSMMRINSTNLKSRVQKTTSKSRISTRLRRTRHSSFIVQKQARTQTNLSNEEYKMIRIPLMIFIIIKLKR
jgi:hypothetical protein